MLRRTVNTRHDPTNPVGMKSKMKQSLLKKSPTHPIISSLHVELDRHERSRGRGSIEVIHELLCNKDIVGDVVSPYKHPLFRIDQLRNNGLHPVYH